MAGTRTTNLNLYKPLFDEEGWDDEVNGNFDTIDTAVAAKVAGSTGTTDETILLADGVGGKTVKTSNKTIVTTLGSGDTTVPTSKAVKDVTDGKAATGHTHAAAEVTGTAIVVGDARLWQSGMIGLWGGSIASIPSGYVLCNGSNSTPDLRDKFIVGAGLTYAVGATGGEATHVLILSEIPSHIHSNGSSGGQTGGGTGGVGFATTNTGSVGGDNAHNNLPPYYALAYIMKT